VGGEWTRKLVSGARHENRAEEAEVDRSYSQFAGAAAALCTAGSVLFLLFRSAIN
jgi:hypothetical protein